MYINKLITSVKKIYEFKFMHTFALELVIYIACKYIYIHIYSDSYINRLHLAKYMSIEVIIRGIYIYCSINTHAYWYICICVYKYIYMWIYVCITIYICVCLFMYEYICICMYKYIYIYICVFMYEYIHICEYKPYM